MVKIGMAQHQLQRFQIMALIQQAGCHAAPTRMTFPVHRTRRSVYIEFFAVS
jgi:hypothetical protein